MHVILFSRKETHVDYLSSPMLKLIHMQVVILKCWGTCNSGLYNKINNKVNENYDIHLQYAVKEKRGGGLHAWLRKKSQSKLWHTFTIFVKQEAHGLHRPPEKTFQINKQNDYIISLIKRTKKTIINFMRIYWFFIWTNLNTLHSRMYCVKFGWNWLSGSGEEDF